VNSDLEPDLSEQEIFWTGRKPALPGQPGPSDDVAYSAALAAACEAAGWQVLRYVAAQGPFGSWLLELQAHDTQHRLFWDARAGRMCLEKAVPAGGWTELRQTTAAGPDLQALVNAVTVMLRQGNEPRS
jgi:hypothetical protein